MIVFSLLAMILSSFLSLLSLLSVAYCSGQFKVHPSSESSTYYHQRKCPLWFYYNSSTRSCQCLSDFPFSCDSSNSRAYLEESYIVTVKYNQSLVTASYWRSYILYKGENGTKPWYRLLPENISDLNDFMCGPLNRKGYLCGECIDGYGPSISIIEHPNNCYRCTDNWHGVILYLIVKLAPVTLFYIIILVFQIRMTSVPMPCFIMYSQLLSLLFSNSSGNVRDVVNQIMFTELGNLRTVSRLTLVLYGIFNLDFISHAVPPFCVNSYLRLNYRAILGYITAFYPMSLILLTWTCIELHDRNIRVIVFLWRPFHRCLVQLRRKWDTKNDLIDVFATFFLFSYVKIMYQTLLVVDTTTVATYSLSRDYSFKNYVSRVDNTIRVSTTTYITGVIFAVLIYSVANLLSVFLIILYPFGLFRKMLSTLRLNRISLMIFMEKIHCCYRDGLDGKRDMRYFSGIYFFLCIFHWVVPGLLKQDSLFDVWFMRGIFFLIAVLLIALCQPYKKMYMNVCDTLLLFHMSIICLMLSEPKNKYFVPFMQMLLLFPFSVLIFVICFRFIFETQRSLKRKRLCQTYFTCLRALCTEAVAIVRPKHPKVNNQLSTYGTV